MCSAILTVINNERFGVEQAQLTKCSKIQVMGSA